MNSINFIVVLVLYEMIYALTKIFGALAIAYIWQKGCLLSWIGLSMNCLAA
jgi:hypothetical protein